MERCCRGCKRPLTPDETLFIKDGLPYCCADCAAATGCTCAPLARPKPALPLEAHLNDWLS